jgi:hypothetical protein
MAHSDKKDPKLNEVRAVLQRLQGLPTGEEPGPSRPPGANQRPAGDGVWLVTAAVIGVTAAGIVGAAYLFTSYQRVADPASGPKPAAEKRTAPPGSDTKDRPVVPAIAAPSSPGGASRPPASAVKPTLDGALDLMARGRIRAAREQLLALAGGGLPPADVAWALARSYDPNHLVTLPAPDAAPDVKEATRWYRLWYGAAVRQGLVADSVSLERIIGSMRE